MSRFKIIEKALKKEGILAIKLLRKELKQQKHIASGKLYDGFYTRISEKGDSVVMAVMNNTPYMWIVNDGKSGGVNASYQAISDWALKKQDRGEIRFADIHALNRFVQKTKRNLEKRYLTRGGERVAPQRYFFIDIVRETIARTKSQQIEDEINKEIIKGLGLDKKEKTVKIKVS